MPTRQRRRAKAKKALLSQQLEESDQCGPEGTQTEAEGTAATAADTHQAEPDEKSDTRSAYDLFQCKDNKGVKDQLKKILKCYMMLEVEMIENNLKAEMKVYQHLKRSHGSSSGEGSHKLDGHQQLIEHFQQRVDQAQATFDANWKLLEAGKPVTSLAAVDPSNSLHRIAAQTEAWNDWRLSGEAASAVNKSLISEENIRKNTKRCTYFLAGRCFKGSLCKFAHSDEELQEGSRRYEEAQKNSADNEGAFNRCGVSDHKEPCRNQACRGRVLYERYKTELCQYRYRVCRRQPRCTFAHTEEELRPLPKSELCRQQFGPKRWCPHDKHCVYSHSKLKVNVNSSAHGTKTGGERASKDSDSDSEHDDHEEPCDDQFCPARLRHETRKNYLCRYMERCQRKATCNQAHSYSELTPLPKKELCDRFWDHENCGDRRCPYIHYGGWERGQKIFVDPAVSNGHYHQLSAHSLIEEECNICRASSPEPEKTEPDGPEFRRLLAQMDDRCVKEWIREHLLTCSLCGRPYSPASEPDDHWACDLNYV